MCVLSRKDFFTKRPSKARKIMKETQIPSAYQTTLLSRHPNRPYTLDIIQKFYPQFIELHGDRLSFEDSSIVAGIGQFKNQKVVYIGHQKGRGTKENVKRNFGMPKPEGYRKALRIMRLAEKFNLPIITFIDTPGAYPGVDAEERGQSEAIARNILEMSRLNVPIITVVIGEGGSGGALAIGVANRVLMLENSTYSVISPEGCASILWKDGTQSERAANILGLTSHIALKNKLIDEIIPEPVGGAHLDHEMTISNIEKNIEKHLKELLKIPKNEIKKHRMQKFFQMGKTKVMPEITLINKESKINLMWNESWDQVKKELEI